MFNDEKLELLKEANKNLNLDKDQEFLRSKNIIFVYSPPKVGSTSLVSSIRLFCANKFTVCHIHDDAMLHAISKVEGITVIEIIKYNKYIGKNVYVIDIYRTPIERKISEYFEKLASYHFNNSDENLNTYDIERIIRRFNCVFPYLSGGDHYMEKYEIPVLEMFNFEKKFLMQELEGIKYVKIRLNDSYDWSSILKQVLNEEVQIVRDYETNNKKFGDLYRRFKELYKIPVNYLNAMRSCPHLKYYLTKREYEKYIEMWGNKSCVEFVAFTEVEHAFYKKICLDNQYQCDFQLDHYIDMGCLCKACVAKRIKIKERIKNGEKVSDKIIHADACLEYNNRVALLVNNKIKEINTAKKSNPSPKIVANVMFMKK